MGKDALCTELGMSRTTGLHWLARRTPARRWSKLLERFTLGTATRPSAFQKTEKVWPFSPGETSRRLRTHTSSGGATALAYCCDIRCIHSLSLPLNSSQSVASQHVVVA